MPTRNVNLTDELDSFVSAEIRSGKYDNASEVIRAALRVLNREEREYEAKLAALRTAIDEGDASGIAKGDVFARVRKTLHLSPEKLSPKKHSPKNHSVEKHYADKPSAGKR